MSEFKNTGTELDEMPSAWYKSWKNWIIFILLASLAKFLYPSAKEMVTGGEEISTAVDTTIIDTTKVDTLTL